MSRCIAFAGRALSDKFRKHDIRARLECCQTIEAMSFLEELEGQQATMKNADLLAKRPPDNEQRFD
jgi:hypothetical protein